jgi:hypothetical protein
MKTTPNMRWIFVALVLGALGGVVLSDRTPSYPQLKASCGEALLMSPRIENVEVWLTANQIPTMQRPGHLLKNVLVDNGVSAAAVDEITTCIYFSGFPVRGGIFSRHVVYGYFFFSRDGSLIEHVMYDIYYGM